ncbi:MAG: hypothetical protein KatS3mg110_1938 [Pirellulaceae bacterium]|nr:MAG: hypothetical protein KatS3mg110_1938 [Pirellulaceae bacterium]
MATKRFVWLATWIVLVAGLGAAAGLAQEEPGWTGRIIKRGEERQVINSLPIIERPYRPLHVYGNTVRRRYYRGTILPAPRDFLRGAAAFVVKRGDSWRSMVNGNGAANSGEPER